jgi:hypothetical protein
MDEMIAPIQHPFPLSLSARIFLLNSFRTESPCASWEPVLSLAS